jgi:hypothetical protein
MKTHLSASLLACFLAASVWAKDSDKAAAIDPKDLDTLRGKRGETVTVEGVIARTGESKSRTHRYLNFTKNYQESISLVFVISKNPTEFAPEKLNAWVGKRVRATGTATEYGSSMQIVIDSWDQIKAVE